MRKSSHVSTARCIKDPVGAPFLRTRGSTLPAHLCAGVDVSLRLPISTGSTAAVHEEPLLLSCFLALTSWIVSKMKDYPQVVCTGVVGTSASFSVAVLASGRPIHEVRLGLVIKMVSAAKISEYVITPHWWHFIPGFAPEVCLKRPQLQSSNSRAQQSSIPSINHAGKTSVRLIQRVGYQKYAKKKQLREHIRVMVRVKTFVIAKVVSVVVVWLTSACLIALRLRNCQETALRLRSKSTMRQAATHIQEIRGQTISASKTRATCPHECMIPRPENQQTNLRHLNPVTNTPHMLRRAPWILTAHAEVVVQVGRID